MENQELIKQVTEKAEKWLTPAYDAETQAEVKRMLENDDKTELIEAFYKDADVQGSYFFTDDYDSRVYASESGLLYTFYTPSFQGRGFRCSIRLRYELNKHFLLITKFGETIYLDRNEIGSGNDLIYGNKKADVQMQLRIKF